MEPNMSAAITGAIAGGVISLIMGWIFRKIDHRHEKIVLAAGIKAELENYKKELHSAIEGNKILLQRVKDSGGKLQGGILINRGSDLVFINASIQKLGLFGKDTVVKIVQLISQHEVMKEWVSRINGSAPNGVNFFASNQSNITQAMDETFNKMISYCNDIISNLENV